MHPQTKKETDILDFVSFIKKYFNWYEIDGFNLKTLQNLSLYANRDKKFNGIEQGWHIDRGLLIWGNPGTGKDELFRLLNQYYTYLNSPYHFTHRIVWEYGGKFQDKENGGYKCFSEEGKGNRYYEELCMLDAATSYPTREVVTHFGTKILIGAELIHVCHNAFKNYGVQSHFSTNVEDPGLQNFYGEMSYSRLKYMCNFMKFVGKDRRKEQDPVFISNINQPPPPPPPRELSRNIEMENRQILEDAYQHFLKHNQLPDNSALLYDSMVAYGVKVAEDEEMREIMEVVEPRYKGEGMGARMTASERERVKSAYVWRNSREIALLNYYNLLKVNGAESIFNIISIVAPGEEKVGEKSIGELLTGEEQSGPER